MILSGGGHRLFQTNLFFMNALPEPDFKYRSKAIALCFEENAAWKTISTGREQAVEGTSPR